MKVLVVGGGGREHAICTALASSGAEIYAVLKNRNPGIIRLSKDHSLVKETDVEKVVSSAQRWGVELAIIGPESPLEMGLADAMISVGIRCVGPTKAAARLETSKTFARNLMKTHGVPGNLDYVAFNDLKDAKKWIMDNDKEVAVKPVGLTGGKGVKVQGEQLRTKDETIAYIEEIFTKKIGGGGVILEERAIGEEFTLQAFVDGKTVVPMPLVQDHKRAYEGDIGPNTGGMGSYSMQNGLLPFVKGKDRDTALDIMKSTVNAMKEEGWEYHGVLYGQFMLTKNGPKVIEYNARFGDPEAMNVLSALDGGFSDICTAVAEGGLSKNMVKFQSMATVCKYVVPIGYGSEPQAGKKIMVDEAACQKAGAKVFFAMVEEKDGVIWTTSSRSIGIVGVKETLEEAEVACEAALKHVAGEAIYVRHDIGKTDIVQKRVEHMEKLMAERPPDPLVISPELHDAERMGRPWDPNEMR